MQLQISIGFVCALAIAFAAYRARALNRSGALAAVLLGTIVFGLGGLAAAVLLVAFFVTSSGLSRLFGRRKRALDEKFSKGSQRDAAQVMANGGAAGLFLLLGFAFPAAAWPFIAAAASLAAANADTWATELGVLNPARPILITSGKPVEPGTSGGVSLAGTLAAAAGSALIALLAVLLPNLGQRPALVPAWAFFIVLTAAGLAGSLVDSFLGATLQAIYRCPACAKETERHPMHTCGAPTTPLRGLPWLDNDLVNALCTFSAAGLAVLFSFLLHLI